MKSGQKTQTKNVRTVMWKVVQKRRCSFPPTFSPRYACIVDRLAAILVFPLPLLPSPPLTHISSRFRKYKNQKLSFSFGTGFCMFVSLRDFSKYCHISIFIKSEAKEIYTKIELCRLIMLM